MDVVKKLHNVKPRYLYFTANNMRLIKYMAYRMGEECSTQGGVKNCLEVYVKTSEGRIALRKVQGERKGSQSQFQDNNFASFQNISLLHFSVYVALIGHTF